MEIRVSERMTGRELRRRILDRWGSRAELERQADAGDAEARADLVDLDLLVEEPSRLDAGHHIETVRELAPEELQRLTPARLELLDVIAQRDTSYNVTELAAAVGRDKKNVSEDIQVLASLGLVRYERRGREKVPHLLGTEVRITFSRQSAAA